MTGAADDALARATAPARWLIEAAASGSDGVPLTDAESLTPATIRDAAERWPDWWDRGDGSPEREADLRTLELLHEGLLRLGLVEHEQRGMVATAHGCDLAADPAALIDSLAPDLGGADDFQDLVASAVADALAGAELGRDEVAEAVRTRAIRSGWRHRDGGELGEFDIAEDVIEVIARGEAYGLLEWPRNREATWSRGVLRLTDVGRLVLGVKLSPPGANSILAFSLRRDGDAATRSADALVAIDESQHLTGLHDIIATAFGWRADRRYSFWLDGRNWGEGAVELTAAEHLSEAPATAELPISELALEPGAELVYVAGPGDQRRVLLTFRERIESDGRRYPRVLDPPGI